MLRPNLSIDINNITFARIRQIIASGIERNIANILKTGVVRDSPILPIIGPNKKISNISTVK